MNIQALLMIRPRHFGFNSETAVSNAFQHVSTESTENIAKTARQEFDAFVHELQKFQIPVKIVEDLKNLILPDSVFPNNWFSTHSNGVVHIYPMLAESRQAEVREDILQQLKDEFGYTTVTDFRKEGGICEGTGSLVFDHENQLAYAVLSPRTEKALVEKVTHSLGYTPVFLEATQNGKPIYHTNVVMCVAPEFTLICLDVLSAESAETFTHTFPANKELLPITIGQLSTFAANMLAMDCSAGKFMIMSETAKKSLMRHQLEFIAQFRKIISVDIPTIEQVGGGSARCMLAEIY